MKDPPGSGHEERVLKRPATADDHRAFVEQLFREHAGFVASFMARLGLAQGDIDDAVQEVFTVAYRKGGFSPDRATARTWLGAIATRVASGQRRARIRRERLIAQPAESVRSDAESAQHMLEVRESLGRVDRALASLEVPLRAVFVLFELEGEDCAAIAEALELPVGTVYSRLHNARKRFIAAHEALLHPGSEPSQRRQRVGNSDAGECS
jgi:RNA polymerase sigma-70 factor (ECF subfamily)